MSTSRAGTAMLLTLLAAALALLLASCTGGEKITSAPAAGDVIQLPEIEWRVVDRAELERVYLAAGMPLTAGQELQGFAAKQGGRTIIYTLPPARVDDAATLTLGHEVLHVALGAYHR